MKDDDVAKTWKLADAKNRLSEVVNLALQVGPQTISRHQDCVVILAEAHYERLRGNQPNFKDALLKGPPLTGLDLSRSPSQMREVDL